MPAAAIQPHEAAAELLARRAARRSLLAFAKYTHPTWTTGAHHERICAFLEKVERGEIKRGIITAPPRHTKSELASRRFPAWYLGKNPTAQIITATYAADFAVDFGADVREIVRSQECKNIFPALALNPDHTAASRWRTSEGGIYVAAGVGGPLTGRGAHLAVIDDPIKNRDEADSVRVRERIWKWYNSTLLTRLMPGGAIILMMTRWHDDDLAGRLLKQGGWEHLELQAIANEDTEDEQPLWPEWFTLEMMQDLRAKLPAREWQALYQQRPTTEGGSYCKREWFSERYDAPPEQLRVYMASDMAVTKAASDAEGRGPDYTEHGVFGIGPDDHVYVLDWWYGRTAPDAWIDAWVALVKKWGPGDWFSEAGVIRRAVEGFIEKRAHETKAYVNIEWMPSITDKEARGQAFRGRASMRTWHFPKTPWADRVIDQCVAFPGGEFDDAFDVCSLFGRAVNEVLAARPKAKEKPRKERWDDEPVANDWKTA